MKIINVTTLFLVAALSGCSNPYAKFYNDNTGGVYPDSIETPTGVPELIHGSNIATDTEIMKENGYDMLGYSSFDGAGAKDKAAIKQARKIQAAKVIVYSKYINTISGVTPVTLPIAQTSVTNVSGNVYSGSGYGSYSGSGTTTTYGSKTTYIPYSTDKYDYTATYWAKVKKYSLGVFADDLNAEIRSEIQSNKGVIVSVVVKKTPAFYADIFKGDIIKSINGTEVTDLTTFNDMMDSLAQKQVSMVIYRKGGLIEKNIKLN